MALLLILLSSVAVNAVNEYGFYSYNYVPSCQDQKLGDNCQASSDLACGWDPSTQNHCIIGCTNGKVVKVSDCGNSYCNLYGQTKPWWSSGCAAVPQCGPTEGHSGSCSHTTCSIHSTTHPTSTSCTKSSTSTCTTVTSVSVSVSVSVSTKNQPPSIATTTVTVATPTTITVASPTTITVASPTTVTVATPTTTTTTTTVTTSGTCSTPTPCTPTWTPIGCWSDFNDHTTLKFKQSNAANFTAATCEAACPMFAYAGLQYYGECWCDETLSPPGVKQPDMTNCNFPCTTDPTQTCGGQNESNGQDLIYITMYQNSCPSIPSTAPPPGWNYAGCYFDPAQPNNRSMPNQGNVNGLYTIDDCTAACANQGFTFAGLEYSNQCYCSNSLPQDGLSYECYMSCNGNPSQNCGGPNALAVFEKGV